MSSVISQSPLGQTLNSQVTVPSGVAQPSGGLPDAQGVVSASDTANNALSHDDTADRQRRAVAAVKDALSKSSGVALPQHSRLVVIADKESGRYVYEFQDPATGEVIVQYPDKHVLAVLAAANVATQGALVSRKI